MYESPIDLIIGNIQSQIVEEQERHVVEYIRNMGISVDKGELVKALQYDRDQYEKGYNAGMNEQRLIMNHVWQERISDAMAKIEKRARSGQFNESVTAGLEMALFIIRQYCEVEEKADEDDR